MPSSSSSKPLVLVTGANQGLGYFTAQQLAGSGNFHVLVGSRVQSKAEDAIKQLITASVDASLLSPIVLDVNDDASISAAAKFVSDKFRKLDILINNVGIASGPDASAGLRDSFRAVFETNVFGVGVLIEAFLPLLRASKYHDRRIVNVTSGLGQMGVTYSNISVFSARAFAMPVYRSSKSALNMLTAVYASTLEDEGILVISAVPGYCRTNLSPYGVKEASEGAKEIVKATIEGDPKRLFGIILGAELECELGW